MGIITRHAVQYGQRRLAQRFGRSLPWFGTAFVLLTVAAAIRRKGVVGGTVDSALNAMPIVGGVKNLVEVVRGRDFIRDRACGTSGDLPA